MYCTRCRSEQDFEVPDPRWRIAFKTWLGVSGFSVLLWPIATFDLFCMTPVLALIPVALGPLHRLANERPVLRNLWRRHVRNLAAGVDVAVRTTGLRGQANETGRVYLLAVLLDDKMKMDTGRRTCCAHLAKSIASTDALTFLYGNAARRKMEIFRHQPVIALHGDVQTAAVVVVVMCIDDDAIMRGDDIDARRAGYFGRDVRTRMIRATRRARCITMSKV